MIFVVTEDEIDHDALAVHRREPFVERFVKRDVRLVRARPGWLLFAADRIAANMIELLRGAGLDVIS